MIRRDELILIGHYNKTHGVGGEIVATLSVDVSQLSCLISDMDGIMVPFFVTGCRQRSTSSVLLTLDGVTSQQEAMVMVNREIYALKRDYMPLVAGSGDGADETDGDYPLDYFIGYELRDSDGSVVGVITDVNDDTDNALFMVGDIMVPASDDLIVEFDTDRRVMVMDLPTGLMELNQ